jgi:hypothetical protein
MASKCQKQHQSQSQAPLKFKKIHDFVFLLVSDAPASGASA